MLNLQGKRVIITGSSRGLGEVCARELSKYGTKLVLMSRSYDKLEEVRKSCINPENHLCLSVDFLDIPKISNAVQKAKEFLGIIDVVLHIAGGGYGIKNPLLTSEEMDKLFKLNLNSIIEINNLIIPDMIVKKKGNIVHVGSIASQEAAASVGYNTVKAALAAYVRTLGRAVAGSGVIVTGIMPGGFYAPGNSWKRLEKENPEVVKKFINDRLPRKFLGKAEEIVPLLLLLCSDNASMLGGCMLPIDAGEGMSYTL